MLGELLLRGVDEALGVVLRLGSPTALLVLLGELLGLAYHLLDVAVVETARGLDPDLLLLAGALVLGGNIDDAVGVDVEGDFDLWNATRRRRDADQVELAEDLVVRGHLALALENADRDRILIILGG